MKTPLTALIASSFVLGAWAVPFSIVALPAVKHLDTEVSTNVAISSWQRWEEKFSFSLSCIATQSNNVEVAFGVDADEDGVLAVGETDLTVGWDCGAWFVRRGVDGARFEAAATPAGDLGSLAWDYRLTAAQSPARLSVNGDGMAIFGPLCVESPAWLHDRRWNLMRLTGRGLTASGETFTIGTSSDPTVIMFR